MDSPGYIKCTVCKVIAVQKSVEGGGRGETLYSNKLVRDLAVNFAYPVARHFGPFYRHC